MKKSFDKKVSIIIPVYNTQIEALKKCFDSVLKQSYKNIEIIVVNDGSSNKITNFCQKYLEKTNIAKIINQDNKGVSEARNNGIKNTTGEYITFIDSDDYVEKNYIEEMIQEVNRNHVDIVFNTATKIYKNKIEKQKIYSASKGYLLYGEKVKEFSPYNLDLMRNCLGKAV